MIASLSDRQRKMLLFLLERDTRTTARQLATRFGVATRTVRYDLEYLRTALKGTGLHLVARPRSGLWIEGEPDRREAVINLVRSVSPPLPTDAVERKHRLALELLTHDDGLALTMLGETLACSRTTVLRDLEEVARQLGTYGLRLERGRGRVRVVGPEQERREALVRLLVETLEPEALLQVGRGVAPGPHWETAGGSNRDAGWAQLSAVVHRAEEALGRKFTDESFVSLVVHLEVTLQRLSAGQEITMPAARLSELQQFPEWPVAESMAGELEALSGIAIPAAERGYITLHLIGGRTQPLRPLTEMEAHGPADPAACTLADQLIERISGLLDVDLTGDEVLRQGLTWHLQGLLTRQRFALAATNPLRAEIQEQMAPVYRAVAQAMSDLGDQVGRNLTEDEIGFLTVHVAAALERRGHPVGVRVLVVCSTGLGSAHLLAARLLRRFKDLHIVGVVSALGTAEAAWPSQVDLVVSTIPLPPLPVPQVQVSPLLTEGETEQLRRAIRTVAGAATPPAAEAEGDPLVEGLMNLLPLYVEIRNKEGLRQALHEYLVQERPPLELAEPVVREVALLGIQVDPTTRAGLALHLQMALPRWRAGQVVSEPDLDRISRQYPSLFRAVERGLQLLGRWHGVTIPPEEVVPVLRYIIRTDKESCVE